MAKRRKKGFRLQCWSRKTFSRLKEVLHLSGMDCLNIHSTLFNGGSLQEVELMEAGIWCVQNDGAGSGQGGASVHYILIVEKLRGAWYVFVNTTTLF